jgi:hypothetical protein
MELGANLGNVERECTSEQRDQKTGVAVSGVSGRAGKLCFV